MYIKEIQYYLIKVVFKATINNISVISWRLVFLIEETQSTRRESHRQTASF